MVKLAPSDQHDKVSLLMLILGFIKFAHDNGKTSFPPFESHYWHEFLFVVKTDYYFRFPELDCIGNFDWDGIHPKCQGLIEAMVGVRLQCYNKFPCERVFLNTDVRDDTSPLAIPSLAVHHRKLAEKVLEIAESIPGFFESQQ